MDSAQELLPITEEEYLEGERLSNVKHEYINGYIYAMVGVKRHHSILSSAINREISYHLKGVACNAHHGEFKLKVGSDYFYPDLMVECDETTDNTLYTETPILIVEVTSKSTCKYDRTYKLNVYRMIPSLKEYVIIEQYTTLIEVYKRVEKSWLCTQYRSGDRFMLESIGLELFVDEIYSDIKGIGSES
ncbi:Uma2 family endonuclease [Magnetococcales bacterium HHB-1]